ncbi:MAG TPA: DNA adenine methylase [Clostridiales bacterium]|nr:DNA adenine methylase [Clostridiales bacterium]
MHPKEDINVVNNNARPFLKWAGGKSQLLSQIKEYFPDKLKKGKLTKYVEPFTGGGAVFFEVSKSFSFEQIVLNDINEELILTYKVIRDSVDELILKLERLEERYSSLTMENKQKMYYEIREQFNNNKHSINLKNPTVNEVDVASHMIFLNKTCYNGLYRLNSKGGFNVPFGKYKSPTICDKINLLNVSRSLQGVILLNVDFEQLTDYIDENTFVYMDPPYRPLSDTSSFNSYQKSPFNDESQRRLANWYRLLNNKIGASLMLSNSDPTNTDPKDTFFEDLYKGFNIYKVFASRAINSRGNERGAISELLITNG